ncbi:abaecin [Augochlora pura]
MKLVMFVMTLLVAVSAIFAFQANVPRPRPGPRFPNFPTFPGHGPFNPYKRPYPSPN